MSIDSQISPEGRERHACRLQQVLNEPCLNILSHVGELQSLFQIEDGLENHNAEKRQVVKIEGDARNAD